MSRLRLAIVSTHPIQYYAPVFRTLAADPRIDLRVFYTRPDAATGTVADAGFNKEIAWDIPLLEGYESQFIGDPGLVPAIQAWRADAVLVYGWNHRAHFAALHHFAGRIPVFFRGDSTLLDERSAWRKLARRVALRWIYSHVDVALAVGSNNRDYFTWCGVPPERIALVPHSVDNARFKDDSGEHRAQAAQWRNDLGISPAERVLVYAGKFMPEKDPLLLLQCFIRAGGDAHLVLVGNGVLEAQMRRRTEEYPNIHFLPFQNQSLMPAVYRLGDVFVLPSRSETWGLAVNEAMASGCPIIASSRVGATRDLIRHGVNGWTFEAGNAIDLSQVLREAIHADHRALASMGELNARAIEGWSTQAAARGIADAVTTHVCDSSYGSVSLS